MEAAFQKVFIDGCYFLTHTKKHISYGMWYHIVCDIILCVSEAKVYEIIHFTKCDANYFSLKNILGHTEFIYFTLLYWSYSAV